MKLSTNSDRAFSMYGDEKAYEVLKNIGYDAIDFSLTLSKYKAYEGLYALNTNEFEEYFKNHRKYAKNAGIEIFQAHAPFPTYPDNLSELNFMLSAIERSILAASIMECPNLVIHCAIPNGWQPDPTPEKTKEINLKIFKSFAQTAEKYNVTIALENMPGNGIPTATPDDIIDYIDTIDSHNFKACLDTGHANLTGIDPGAFVKALGSRLQVCHIHDNNGKSDQHLCPYLGTINWNSFLCALRDTGYRGTFNLEADQFQSFFPDDAYLDAEKLLFSTITAMTKI